MVDHQGVVNALNDQGAATPFKDLTVVDRTTLIDISSDTPLSEEKDIWTSGVTRDAANSEHRIRANASTESITTVRYVPYSIGYIVETGIALRIPTAPTGDQEVRWGYWDGDDGVYWGWDATGFFTEFERGGSRQGKTRRDSWVGEDKDVDLETALKEGVVTRLILSLYNYGQIGFEAFPRNDETNKQTRSQLHIDSPRETTTLSRQNLPLRVEVDNPASEDFDVFLADRQASLRGARQASRRVTPAFRTGVSLSGTTWVPLVGFRRVAGEEGVAVETFNLSVQSDDDVILQLRADVDGLTDASWGTPGLVSSSETVLEADTSATAVNATSGFSRWLGSAEGGGGPDPVAGTQIQSVDLRLKRDRNMVLLARMVSGSGGNIPLVIMSMQEQW